MSQKLNLKHLCKQSCSHFLRSCKGSWETNESLCRILCFRLLKIELLFIYLLLIIEV